MVGFRRARRTSPLLHVIHPHGSTYPILKDKGCWCRTNSYPQAYTTDSRPPSRPATVPGMAEKGWISRVATAAGAAAGTGAAQLGLRYGLGVGVWRGGA